MAEKRTFICEVCRAEQVETNHWFVVVINRVPELRLLPLGALKHSTETRIGDLFHLCGETCAIQKIGEFLRTQQ